MYACMHGGLEQRRSCGCLQLVAFPSILLEMEMAVKKTEVDKEHVLECEMELPKPPDAEGGF